MQLFTFFWLSRGTAIALDSHFPRKYHNQWGWGIEVLLSEPLSNLLLQAKNSRSRGVKEIKL